MKMDYMDSIGQSQMGLICDRRWDVFVFPSRPMAAVIWMITVCVFVFGHGRIYSLSIAPL